MTESVYLRSFLAPLSAWLDDPRVSDILINQPGEVWIEASGQGLRRVEARDVTALMLQRLAQQIAAFASQGVNREHPLLAATLPDGARVQVVAPPATRGSAAIAIRKHTSADLTLDQYAATGAFQTAKRAELGARTELDLALDRLLDAHRVEDFLRLAVRSGKTILISGGTGSGKTTLLNALLKEIPETERLIVIEDTAEVRLWHPNSVGLLAVRGAMGEARVSVNELLEASLRMRPDRLLLGELRGPEAFAFLRAINTGHPGSISTVHADCPASAIDQLAFMTLQAGLALRRDEIVAYAKSVVDVIVQLSRAGGRRVVTGIAFHRNGA